MPEAGGVGKTKITWKMFTVVTFMAPPALYSNTEIFVPLPAEIAEGWVIWCDVARDSTCGNKTGHKKLKRAENQNEQILNCCLMMQVSLWPNLFSVGPHCKVNRTRYSHSGLTPRYDMPGFSGFISIGHPALISNPNLSFWLSLERGFITKRLIFSTAYINSNTVLGIP